MSIMDAFRNIAGVGTTPQTGANPIPPAVSANPTVPGSQVVPDGTGPAAFPAVSTDADKSPLGNFAGMWQPDPTKDAKPIAWKPDIKTDPAKVKAASEALNFTNAIPPEVLAAAAKGDVSALAKAINMAGQQGFASAVETNTAIVNEALEKQATMFKNDVVPAILKDYSTSQALRADNPLYEDPAAAPMLSMVESQLKLKYPDAPPSEIKSKANEYLNGFAGVVAKNSGFEMTKIPQAKTGGVRNGETDWGEWLKG